jgi:hypothetical protein
MVIIVPMTYFSTSKENRLMSSPWIQSDVAPHILEFLQELTSSRGNSDTTPSSRESSLW